MNNELFYGIALSLLKGVGDSNAKQLISYAGSAEKLFKLSQAKLQKINGIGPKLAAAFEDTYEALKRAEAMLEEKVDDEDFSLFEGLVEKELNRVKIAKKYRRHHG